MDEQHICNIQHNAGFKTSNDSDFEITTPSMNSLEKLKKESFNLNPAFCSSLNKMPMNTSYNVATDSTKECKEHDNELIEVKTDLSNSAEQDKNVIKPVDNWRDYRQISSSLSCHNRELEQMNIVECLLDLDDYLEKIGENCLKAENSALNSKRRTATMRKNSSSSNVILPFDRCSKLRKTTAGISDTQRKAPEYKTECIQRTWNSQMGKRIYNQNKNKSINSVTDMKTENSSVSTSYEESERPEGAFADSFAAGKSSIQVLTNEQIFQNLIQQQSNIETGRPRQYGRRAERFSTFASHLRGSTPIFTRINYENLNADNTNSTTEGFCNRNELYTGSDGNTTRTSRNTTPVSAESSTDSIEFLPLSENLDIENNAGNQDTNDSINRESTFPSLKFGFNSYWPHDYSRAFALISCTLGLFNTSRFASLTLTYGGNFLIQFFILSIIFGIPFLWLQILLGAKIKAGPVWMWKISPICIGIGISITVVQFFIAIYSTIAVVWLLKIIQDLFIYKSSYAWSESAHYTEDRDTSHSVSNLTENIPIYFNVHVLQRMKLLKINVEHGSGLHINDRVSKG